MKEVKGEGDGEGKCSVSSQAAISSRNDLRQQDSSMRRVTQGEGWGVGGAVLTDSL